MGNKLLLRVNVASPKQTIDLAKQIGRRLKGGELIELSSDLGGGKTTFVKGLVKGAGSRDHVSSPSFTLRNDYSAQHLSFAHFDFYRLSDPGILKNLLAEAINDPGLSVVIEWAAVVSHVLPTNHLVIKLIAKDENARLIEIKAPPSMAYLIKDLK